jgi:hypothetical protein
MEEKRPSSVRFPTSTYGIVLDQEITDCGTGTQASVAERPVELPPVTREQRHANHDPAVVATDGGAGPLG